MPHTATSVDSGRNKPRIVAPSILSADFARLADSIARVKQAPWIHVDVMDGHFVPNITIGPPVVAALRQVTEQFLDVHLMIDAPERYIEAFAKAGADGLTVSAEACTHLHRVVQQIRAANMRPGVALNPATPVNQLRWVVAEVDLVLIMTVNPGFGGQKFVPAMADKVAEAHQLVLQYNPGCNIEVDGGVDRQTIRTLAAAGANVFVAGSAVFANPDPGQALAELYAALD